MKPDYITRGMSAPKGKPRVYFSCHPADFNTAFPLITEDILKHSNCAIWYDTEPSVPANEQELEEILSDMQLAVFAVTSVFLEEENRARNVELPLAMKHHVPVLPIMLENGLGYKFSNTCAKIQVVSKYVNDPTATPYEEVLETFLNSVLVGDELAEKVRNAFDAYVFLSYRKKDRSHAQRLMRLIHENPQFRDIAIWYDEYLVPGEAFNDAIKDAFAKSSLFAMAVTPHLEEEGNYVMRVEYPMARDREIVDERFEVVPVEMYEKKNGIFGKPWRIKQARLKKCKDFKYTEITDLKDEHQRTELDRAFIEALARMAKKPNDGSAQHRFFIGLAYLNGIDMEVDPEKALELLESASKDREPCMDATAKLADMYRNGEGVEANQQTAIFWQERLAEQYLHAYEENHNPDEHKGYGTAHFKALRKLSDMYKESGDLSKAVEIAQKAFKFSHELDKEVGIREQERDQALILNRLGSLYRESGDTSAAEEYFGKAARIYERQAGEIGTQRARRDLSISYERLGDLHRKRGDYVRAEAYYQKAKTIREELNAAHPTAASRRDLSAIWTKLGNVRKSMKQYDDAAVYYIKALAMDEVLAAEIKAPQSYDDYGVSLVKTGDIHKARGRFADAAECYEKACGIFKENIEKTASNGFREHYAGGCEKLASARKKLGEKAEADRLYREAVDLRQQLYDSAKTIANASALATSYYNYGIFRKSKDYLSRARQLWDELSKTDKTYEKYRDDAVKMIEKIG